MVGTTHNALLSGDIENGINNILILGHDDEVKSGPNQDPEKFVTFSQNKWVHIWDAQNHNVTWSYKSSVTPISCCFSNDGTLLLIGLENGTWKVIGMFLLNRPKYKVRHSNLPVFQSIFSQPTVRLQI